MARKATLAITVFVLVALALSGCAGAKKGFEGPVKVGMMTVLTGPAASVGEEQRNWAKLAMDQFNEAGGVGGIQVEMVEGDTEFDPAKSVLAAERLVADAAV